MNTHSNEVNGPPRFQLYPMMADFEEGDTEVFEISDFTSASDWERFVGAVTELLHEWRAVDQPTPPSQQRQARVDFAGCGFTVTYHDLGARRVEGAAQAEVEGERPLPTAMAELAEPAADFRPSHPVAEAFGVRRFIALQSTTGVEVDSESKARIVLSSLHVALRDAGWDIPMFVQVYRASMLYFVGVCVGDTALVEFHTILLSRAPPRLYYLSGLLDMLKQKVSAAAAVVSVSVRLQYAVVDFGPLTYVGAALDPADPETVFPELEGLQRLPVDAIDVEPLAGIDLMASWHQVADSLLVEDEFTKLNPRNAPRWTVRARPAARTVGLLGLCLRDVWQMCHRLDTFDSLVGRPIVDAPPLDYIPDVYAALSRLTDQQRTPAAPPPASREADITADYVDQLCSGLFSEQGSAQLPAIPAGLSTTVKGYMSDVKSCRPGDLLWRLGQVMCLLARSQSASLLCLVWERFVQELRRHWEDVRLVSGVAEGSPSFTTSLLHQKLQMLNCCTEKRAQGMKNSQEPQDIGDGKDDADDDDDEFFDAAEEGPGEAEVDRPSRAPWNEPEGRLKACGSLLLLQTNETMYIPVTQDVAPMTEDRLKEQSDVLVGLGTDPEGCLLRARLMAASLTSDMEAFKAANPGAILADFIRWYSPRDWVQAEEDDSGRGGELSARMQTADNLWVETWTSCKPVPARRQRRLFDETREAERLFHQLTAYRPADVIRLLAPIIYHAAIYRLVEELEPADLAVVGQQLEEAARRLHSTAKADWEPKAYEAVGELLAACEHHVLRRRSLALKLDGVPGKEELVQQLLGGAEVTVPGGARGDAARQLERMLTANQPEHELPPPSRKEYILRVRSGRPGPGSRPLPHRLRCLVTDDQFRLSASFSQDTVFS